MSRGFPSRDFTISKLSASIPQKRVTHRATAMSMMSVKYRHTTGNSVGVGSAQWSFLIVGKKKQPIYPNKCINKQQSKNVSSSDASVLRYANFMSSHDAPIAN